MEPTDKSADNLTQEIYSTLLQDHSYGARFGSLFDHLKPSEQIAILEAIFRDVQKKYFSHELSGTLSSSAVSSETITGVATLCSTIIEGRALLKSQVTEWLEKGQGGSIQAVGLRRALLATYTGDSGKSHGDSMRC